MPKPAKVIPIMSASAEVEDSAQFVSMYQKQPTIYPRAVKGWFANWRWVFVWLTQLLFYGLPWLQWSGRQAVLFDLDAQRFYIFGLLLYPQDLIFLAALQNVPQSQYEAAMIDGASKWQMFMKVTVPLITPVIFFNFIMQTTQAFQEFTGPYVITGGGPTYSTYLFSLYIYDTAFKYFDMGYGAALAWVLFLVVAVFAGIAFKSSKYWVFYSADKGGKNG